MTPDCLGDPPAGNPDRSALDAERTRFSEPSPSPGFAPGTRIHDHYEITGPGIPGGMGVVYPVIHRELEECRALKVLHPFLVGNPDAVARFREEARLTLKLLHPGIVRVYDFGDWAGQKYLVMEWVPGGSLREYLQRSRDLTRDPRLPLREALRILGALAEALAYAHAQHVLHRDLKPENILLDHNQPKLTDFGIAKLLGPGDLTTTAARLGTAYYMAPEQLQGRAVDARADIYGFGVILYELVTGDLPVGRFKLPHELGSGLPAALDAFIEKCLAPRAADRFKDVAELKEGIGLVVSDSHGSDRGIAIQSSNLHVGEAEEVMPNQATGPIRSPRVAEAARDEEKQWRRREALQAKEQSGRIKFGYDES